MIHVCDFRERSSGGAVVPGRLVAGDAARLFTAERVCFLLHGFNVNREDGMASLNRLAAALPLSSEVDELVCVLWPGDHWSGALSYSFENRDADDSASALMQFVELACPRRPTLSFVAHSLGCRVAMRAAELARRGRWRIDQVCLLAAAIDDDSLASSSVYRAASRSAQRVATLHSHQDRVLRFAYPAGDLLQAFVFADELARGALGYHGPRPRRGPPEAVPESVTAQGIADARRAGHGDYLPDEPPNEAQRSAAAYVDEVLSGVAQPRYP